MDGKRFDDLSKNLATRRSSRRRFSQRLGGGLLGAALTSLGLNQTMAAQGGNNAAAQWCREQFSGRAAGQCTAAAAQGEGPFYECGPGGDGSLMLCETTCAECCSDSDCPGGTCTTDGWCSSLTCEDQGLQTCGDDCIETTECCGDCPSGETCVNGTCESDQQVPATCSAESECGTACLDTDSTDCQCGSTIEGSPVCYNFMTGRGCAGGGCTSAADCVDVYGPDSTCIAGFCSTPEYYCTTDDGCGPGYACVNMNLGCGGCDAFTGGKGICMPICYAS